MLRKIQIEFSQQKAKQSKAKQSIVFIKGIVFILCVVKQENGVKDSPSSLVAKQVKTEQNKLRKSKRN